MLLFEEKREVVESTIDRCVPQHGGAFHVLIPVPGQIIESAADYLYVGSDLVHGGQLIACRI